MLNSEEERKKDERPPGKATNKKERTEKWRKERTTLGDIFRWSLSQAEVIWQRTSACLRISRH